MRHALNYLLTVFWGRKGPLIFHLNLSCSDVCSDEQEDSMTQLFEYQGGAFSEVAPRGLPVRLLPLSLKYQAEVLASGFFQPPQ